MSATPFVTGRHGVLSREMTSQNISLREMAAETGVSRATIQKVATEPGYGIAKEKAEKIAAALKRPVGAIFVHKDGAPLGAG